MAEDTVLLGVAQFTKNVFIFSFQGHPKSLDQFTYKDSDINDVILSCVSNVSFSGVSGNVWFEQGYDPPIRDVYIERIEGTPLR